MEAQHGNAPLVHGVGIDIAVAVLVGNHFAASGETDVGAVPAAAVLFERRAVSFMLFAGILELAHARHAPAAAKLDVVSAQKIILAVVSPPRHVQVHAAHAVMIVRRHFLQSRKISAGGTADRVRQVTADRAGRIGQAVGKQSRAGIQQQARRLAGARSHHEGPGMHPFFGARGFVDVSHGFGLAIFSHHDLAGHGARDQSEASGGLRRRNHDLAGTEVGSGQAAPAALRAIVAGGAPVQRLGENRQPRRHAGNVQFVAGLLDDGFGATRRRRRQKNAVRRAGNILLAPEHADVGLDFIVVRRNFFVGDGPVVAHAIGGARPEIHRGKAESDASPVIGASAHNAGAEPAELRSCRGSVGFAFDFPGAVGRNEFVVQFMPVFAADANPAMRQLVGPHVLLEIFFRIQRRACFQHDYVQAAFGEHFRGRAASRARSNDADVIHFRGTNDLCHQALRERF